MNVLKVIYDRVGLLQKEELCGVTGKGPPLSRIYLPFFHIVVKGLSRSLFLFTFSKFTFCVTTEGHVFKERSLYTVWTFHYVQSFLAKARSAFR